MNLCFILCLTLTYTTGQRSPVESHVHLEVAPHTHMNRPVHVDDDHHGYPYDDHRDDDHHGYPYDDHRDDDHHGYPYDDHRDDDHHGHQPTTYAPTHTHEDQYHTLQPRRRLDAMYDHDHSHHHGDENPGSEGPHEEFLGECDFGDEDHFCSHILTPISVKSIVNSAHWKTQIPNPHDYSGPRYGSNGNTHGTDMENPFIVFHSDLGSCHNYMKISLLRADIPDRNGYARLKFTYWAHSDKDHDEPIISSILLTCGSRDNIAHHYVNVHRNSAAKWIYHSIDLNYDQAMDGCLVSFPQFEEVVDHVDEVNASYYHMVLVYNNIAFDNIEFYHVDDCFNCGQYAMCMNHYGERKCMCKPNYKVDQYNRCQPDCGYRCHVHAICVGPGVCECEIGYVGHGWKLDSWKLSRLGEGCIRDPTVNTLPPRPFTTPMTPAIGEECIEGLSLIRLPSGEKVCEKVSEWSMPIQTGPCSQPCGPGSAKFKYLKCGNGGIHELCDPEDQEFNEECFELECNKSGLDISKTDSCIRTNIEYKNYIPVPETLVEDWLRVSEYHHDVQSHIEEVAREFSCNNRLPDADDRLLAMLQVIDSYKSEVMSAYMVLTDIRYCATQYRNLDSEMDVFIEVYDGLEKSEGIIQAFIEYLTEAKAFCQDLQMQ